MKLFIGLIIAAAIIGGLAGADSGFSTDGAVAGGILAFLVSPILSAFLEARKSKQRNRELPPEVRGVFDRMFGVDTLRSGKTFSEAMHEKTKMLSQTELKDSELSDLEREYLVRMGGLVTMMIMTCLLPKEEVVKKISENERALGYLYGVHQEFLTRMGLYKAARARRNTRVIEKSYLSILGDKDGFSLLSKSVPLMLKRSPEFLDGVAVGMRDLEDFADKGIHPLALSRILVLGMKE